MRRGADQTRWWKRRLLWAALLLVLSLLAMLAAATPAPAADAFKDVPSSNSYYDAIEGLYWAGVIDGYAVPSGKEFRPGLSIKRAQFAKMILGVLEIPVAESEWQDANRPFNDFEPDVSDNLYPHDYVAAAFRLGITTGKTATTFEPYVDIKRIQVISMVVRAAKANKPGAVLDPPSGWSGFLGSYYSDPNHGQNVRIAEYNGLLDGLVGFGSSWNAEANATRGEAAQIMWNLYIAEDSGLLFYDDFSDPTSGWTLVAANEDYKCGYQPGRPVVLHRHLRSRLAGHGLALGGLLRRFRSGGQSRMRDRRDPSGVRADLPHAGRRQLLLLQRHQRRLLAAAEAGLRCVAGDPGLHLLRVRSAPATTGTTWAWSAWDPVSRCTSTRRRWVGPRIRRSPPGGSDCWVESFDTGGIQTVYDDLAVWSVSDEPPAAEEEFFRVLSLGVAYNGASSPTVFTLYEPWKVTEIRTYHWNQGQGVWPGTIGLRADRRHDVWALAGDGTAGAGWCSQRILGGEPEHRDPSRHVHRDRLLPHHVVAERGDWGQGHGLGEGHTSGLSRGGARCDAALIGQAGGNGAFVGPRSWFFSSWSRWRRQVPRRPTSSCTSTTSSRTIPTTTPSTGCTGRASSTAMTRRRAARSSGPAVSIKRAQFAKMILGVLEIPVAESEWQDANRPFNDFEPDVSDNLYPHDYVAAAFRLGITTGKTATTFEPYVDIKRIQVISMVVRAAKANKPGAVLDPPSGWSGFLGSYYSDPNHGQNVRIAEYNGLLDGLVGFGSSWNADAKATRGEAAQIMWNLYIAEDSGLLYLR